MTNANIEARTIIHIQNEHDNRYDPNYHNEGIQSNISSQSIELNVRAFSVVDG